MKSKKQLFVFSVILSGCILFVILVTLLTKVTMPFEQEPNLYYTSVLDAFAGYGMIEPDVLLKLITGKPVEIYFGYQQSEAIILFLGIQRKGQYVEVTNYSLCRKLPSTMMEEETAFWGGIFTSDTLDGSTVAIPFEISKGIATIENNYFLIDSKNEYYFCTPYASIRLANGLS